MSDTNWKRWERTACRALGGERSGPAGRGGGSDCVGTIFSPEIKRSAREGPPVLSKWILQAKAQAKREKKPWCVVVRGHNDRRPIVTLDFWEFIEILQEAGRVPELEIAENE